jgi:MFS family permease
MKRAYRLDAAAAVIAVCAFAAMDSAMSPSQEQVIATLHLSAVQYAWVSATQFLFIAISAPLIGRCGDVFDKRSVLAIALGIACTGGLLAGSATSILTYMATQTMVCAWVGALTVAMALMAELSPPESKASGQGILQGATGFFASAALLGAGPVMNAFGTLSLFWLPAALALPCVFILGRQLLRPRPAMPRAAPAGRKLLDIHGALTLGGMLALLSVALQFITSGGWMTALAIACLAAMGLMLPRWVSARRRQASPFVDVMLLARRDVALIHVVSLMLGVGTTAIYVLLPMMVTAASAAGASYGSSALVVGALLLPTGLTSALLMPVYAPLDRHLGPRGVLVLGLACMAAALAVPIFWRHEIWPLLASTSLFGIGISLAYTEGITELLRIVPPERGAGVSGTFQLAKTIGALLGSSGFSVVLGAGGDSSAVAGLAQLSTAFAIATGAAVVGMLVAAGVGPRQRGLGDNHLVPRRLED